MPRTPACTSSAALCQRLMLAPCCLRHLRDLLRDAARSELLFHEHNKIISDFSRQRVTQKTIEVGHIPLNLWESCADAI